MVLMGTGRCGGVITVHTVSTMLDSGRPCLHSTSCIWLHSVRWLGCQNHTIDMLLLPWCSWAVGCLFTECYMRHLCKQHRWQSKHGRLAGDPSLLHRVKALLPALVASSKACQVWVMLFGMYLTFHAIAIIAAKAWLRSMV